MQVNTLIIQDLQAGKMPNSESRSGQQHTVTGADEFTSTLRSLKTHTGSLSTAHANKPPQAHGLVVNSKPDKEVVSKALEAMLVAQFLSPLFASSESEAFGSGVQGDITKSLFTDAIANAITERGGIGLGKYI